MSSFASPRTFRVWLYTVSHSTLLLRSTRGGGYATRIDVVFKPVVFMSLPTELRGMNVREIALDDHEAGALLHTGDRAMGSKVFSLSDSVRDAWVVGGVMAFHEDEGGDFEPGYFGLPRLRWS